MTWEEPTPVTYTEPDPDCPECEGSGLARMCSEPDCEFFFETIPCLCTVDFGPDVQVV